MGSQAIMPQPATRCVQGSQQGQMVRSCAVCCSVLQQAAAVPPVPPEWARACHPPCQCGCSTSTSWRPTAPTAAHTLQHSKAQHDTAWHSTEWHGVTVQRHVHDPGIQAEAERQGRDETLPPHGLNTSQLPCWQAAPCRHSAMWSDFNGQRDRGQAGWRAGR